MKKKIIDICDVDNPILSGTWHKVDNNTKEMTSVTAHYILIHSDMRLIFNNIFENFPLTVVMLVFHDAPRCLLHIVTKK